VLPVAVPHDSREPVQYCLRHQGVKLGVLTDLGSVSGSVVEHFDQCDGLLLEANHDLKMLQAGPYPYFLKKRVSSDWGHLNNQQAGHLLSLIERRRIQTLVLGHISEQNNHRSLVEEAVSAWVGDVGKTLYACQKEGFPWQVIE
jgi:phosphoribosyl 1,2-cyclic phosphodiesterase